MKTRLMMLLMGGLSVFLPFEINKPPRPPIAKVWAYDPLTAEFIDFRKGMQILKNAGVGTSYDILYKQLKEAGFNFPYSPPPGDIKSQQQLYSLDVLEIENLAPPRFFVIEKSPRMYILYQFLTGKTEISRVGLDEIKYGFDRRIIIANVPSNQPDTLTLDYLFGEPSIACLEYMTIALSILWSYGEYAEGKIVIGDKGGHAFVKWKGLIIDDEISASEKSMLEYYKKEWGTDIRTVVRLETGKY
ncbi:MAG: hypothetical protein QXG02_03600 [Candidatus Anstonellales archaeon]